MRIAVLIVIIISIRAVFLRANVIYSNSQQGKLMAAINSRNKGPKNARCNVLNRLKFGKIFTKDLLRTKM